VEEQSVWELLLIDRGNSAAVDERRQPKMRGAPRGAPQVQPNGPRLTS